MSQQFRTQSLKCLNELRIFFPPFKIKKIRRINYLKCLRNNEFKLRYNNDKIEIGTLPHFGITKEFV